MIEKKFEVRKYSVGVYRFIVHFINTNDLSALEKYLNDNGINNQLFLDDNDIYADTVYLQGDQDIFIILNMLNEQKPTIATLSHEVNHVASRILDYVGYKFDPYNDEPFTYLAEYIFECGLDFYKDIKKN